MAEAVRCGWADVGVCHRLACEEAGLRFLGVRREPFDLCVIDEAHEVFANIYRRFDKHGDYRVDSPEARIADRVRSFLRQTPVLLLTATPIQNNLAELWGLIQYVEPTGTLLGNLRTFRDIFCDGDDRTPVKGQDDELRRRIERVVKRTLRRQANDFLERPFVARCAQIFEYSMTPKEKLLYDKVTAYLLEPQLFAFRGNQRQLLLIGFHRLMGSSVAALTASLRKVAARLDRMLKGLVVSSPDMFLDDLDDEDLQSEPGSDESEAIDPSLVEEELERVRSFISLAETLHRDSKVEKLLDVIRVIGERPPGRQRAVIFTESLVTQAYLENLLATKGGFHAEEITLFRGTNDSPRAMQALKRWQEEIGDTLPPHQRPSHSVAVRLGLVHEFKTRSRVFISTEAGAKGLNLQFCDTIINYDLPWNPQRIEQRIGRCHRYGQEHDVTVINFLAADNEAQRLTFEILSRKLDLFGRVLDASDVVLHEPSTDAPETLAGAVGSDFESRLRRIYERARTVGEIEAELRRLREQMEDERKRFEDTWARTAGLIESRFDQSVKQVFHRLQADLPAGLARLDDEIDQLVTGYFLALGVRHRRIAAKGHIRFELSPSGQLPEGWREGGIVAIGDAKDLDEADPLHLGHPLVHAAVEEARTATETRAPVAWIIDRSATRALTARKGARGRLILIRIRYDGFERVDRLIPIAMLEGESSPLDIDSARWLLHHEPHDRPELQSMAAGNDTVDDLIEELVFTDQAEVASYEQRPFERNLEQIERYVEDQLMVLRRRLNVANGALRAAEDRRAAALGAEARSQAETRVRTIQEEIDSIKAEVDRLEVRDDAEYQRWHQHVHDRRSKPPQVTRLLDVEFVLE